MHRDPPSSRWDLELAISSFTSPSDPREDDPSSSRLGAIGFGSGRGGGSESSSSVSSAAGEAMLSLLLELLLLLRCCIALIYLHLFALSSNGMYIATASEQGTLIRVHLVSESTKKQKVYYIVMIMGSLLSWSVSEKLSVGLLAPPSCKDSSLLLNASLD
uniref:Uncharacterized protein n=1 Tax=Brassica oleracea var. oleracea TaxID=109376 RepID=A0A0D3D721_BRAOL